MKIIKSKPINNSSRHQIKLSKFLLAKKVNFINSITIPKKSSYGKSQPSGRISAWHRQRGVKRLYRPIDFLNHAGLYLTLFSSYDPNRTSFSSVVFDLVSKRFRNYISTSAVAPGCLVQVKRKLPRYRLGYRMQLKNLPTGSLVNNVGNFLGNKVSYIKAAGSVGQIIQVSSDSCKIKLPSGKLVEIPASRYATLGSVSNEKNNLIYKGKAGRNRNLGRRPIVRGIAMNPVDHPHGGRTNGGRPSVTPWGLPTKSKFYLKKRTRK
jgi:large subunit ribosomal protein L2